MTLLINSQRCRRCGGHPRCADVCPGNLLVLPERGHIVSREPDDCWDCGACIKVCPQQALAVSLPPEAGGQGSTLRAKQIAGKIRWTLEHPDGRLETIDL
ncbi:4Fe-4S dicluster domain-containing protein [Heliobacterium mobile]|uniref:4Fe-4S dicluster domain-containing protein n=1 Tax=Heliobacterium mobile TaxID=28064 RepID=UPI001A9BFC7D|nr:4Fe-4S dicluster domain-containing protein [Heliobacterium mobile]